MVGTLPERKPLLRRGKQSGLRSGNVPTIAALVDRADDKLFESILHNPHHVLNSLMPDETVCSYTGVRVITENSLTKL